MTAQAVQETKYCPDSGDIQSTLSHFWYASCTVLLAQLYKKHSVMFNSNRSLQRHEKAIYAARESLLNVLNQRGTDASKDLGIAQHSVISTWGGAPHHTREQCTALGWYLYFLLSFIFSHVVGPLAEHQEGSHSQWLHVRELPSGVCSARWILVGRIEF